jgi:D-alanine-D-alanine ligase
MQKKLRIGILFGGRSGEHDVSLLSAASIFQAIDRKKFEIIPIGITRQGRWVTASSAQQLLSGTPPAPVSPAITPRAGDPAATEASAILARGEAVLIPPQPGHSAGKAASTLVPFETDRAQIGSAPAALQLDVIFPVLHGTFGEDGTVQGLLELAGIPYVGSGVLGSAAGMDKDVMKRLFAAAGLPIVPHVTILRSELGKSSLVVTKRIEKALKYPLFVKPANLGSSVGISKVHDRAELAPALALAAGYDRKIVVEQGVQGRGQNSKARELEVAVLGNDDPQASVVGEIVPGKEFYDYEAKYLSEGSVPLIPAPISKTQTKQVREMAIAAFRACDCSGLARVDFLLNPSTGKLFLNEINTLPGFTSISMYPKLWAASGLAYRDLITRLIELAVERAADRAQNQYTRE